MDLTSAKSNPANELPNDISACDPRREFTLNELECRAPGSVTHSDAGLVMPWIRRFLKHLATDRELSPNTQISYRDALMLLLTFVSRQTGVEIGRLSFHQLSPQTVRTFLDYVERERRCSIATRNQRLSVIHSLAHYIRGHSIDASWCEDVLGVTFKKMPMPRIAFLQRTELKALFRAPDPRTASGARDQALLLFLYNTGARAAEVARLRIDSLQLDSSPSVRIADVRLGARVCPLWAVSVALLRPLIAGRAPTDAIFRGRTGAPLTRFAIYNLVTGYAKLAAKRRTSLAGRPVTPHTLRNTAAVHLLRAGVDIRAVQSVLGSISIGDCHVGRGSATAVKPRT